MELSNSTLSSNPFVRIAIEAKHQSKSLLSKLCLKNITHAIQFSANGFFVCENVKRKLKSVSKC
jgi:hypothetical protein